MVRLDLDLPVPIPLEDLRIAPRYPEMIQALERCEFKTLMDEIRAEAGRELKLGQGELFG
jgi:DNA polymerase-1